ncbi:MAG: DUF1499 domain-containing protein [Fibrobacterales bacterium]
MKNIFLTSALGLLFLGCSSNGPIQAPSAKTLTQGILTPCPSSPNCVGSFEAQTNEHYITPFFTTHTPDQAITNLKSIIETQSRTTIAQSTSNYIHATYTSLLLRFVDDVEFLVVNDTIHIRSASRTGYSDLGVNRERLEHIRTLLNP